MRGRSGFGLGAILELFEGLGSAERVFWGMVLLPCCWWLVDGVGEGSFS